MTDTRLRELERRAASGSVEDAAAWLAARMRAGEVSRERVELAAYCGHEAARVLLGWPLRDDSRGRLGYPTHPAASRDGKTVGSTNDLGIWLNGLGRWGHMVLVRAGVAAAREVWEEVHTTHGALLWVMRLVRAIESAEAWLACPCEEHRKACKESIPHTPTYTGPTPYTPDNGTRWWTFLVAAVAYPRWAEGVTGKHACVVAAEDAARIATEPAVRAAIQRALIAWALGGSRETRESRDTPGEPAGVRGSARGDRVRGGPPR